MKIENRNYKKEVKEPQDKTFGIIGIVVTIVALAFTAYVLVTTDINKNISRETVSIHKYNALELRMKYLFMENQVKNQLLYDLAVDGKSDTAFVLSIQNHISLDFLLNPNTNRSVEDSVKKEHRERMAFHLDSICADWYESIPFMFIDAEHDSTWVLNSESYQRSMLMANDLRNKWE